MHDVQMHGYDVLKALLKIRNSCPLAQQFKCFDGAFDKFQNSIKKCKDLLCKLYSKSFV